MKRLLAFSTLPREGPSVRPRVLAYEAALADRGIGLDLAPFLTPAGFAGFYSPRLGARLRKSLVSAAGYLRRRRRIAEAGAADGVLVHREIVPRGNRGALRALRRHGRPLAYDIDDAIWLRPRDFVASGEASRRRMFRFKDPREIDDLIAAADLVLAGNAVIAEHAGALCRDVRIQPTPVDTDRFRPRPRPDRERPLVGWIGSPTAAYCLKEVAPALTRAHREEPFDLLVVGAGERIDVPGVPAEKRDWTLDAEPRDFASLDVGLYPLPDNPWTRGKCGMKALQYLSSGVAAVVSPVGVNREIVEDGRTGLLASTADEWTEALLAYLRDPALRARHAIAGREAVVDRWSLDVWSAPFADAMESLLA